MVGATRRSTISLAALVAGAGCLATPPVSDEGPPPTALCTGDPGLVDAELVYPWSVATLPGWSQGDAVAGDLEDWFIETAVFNHVLHGAIAATADGSVTYAGGDLTGSAQSCAAVVAAHRLGYPIMIVLGGDHGDDALAIATGDDSRAHLVAGLLDFIDTYGYDGISIAWISGVVPEQMSALVDELSTAFDLRTPRPLLTVDVSSGAVDPVVTAGFAERVDAIDLESYGANWEEELDAHITAGVPPSKINLGIGLSALDRLRADVRAKIARAIDSGLRGVTSWEMGALESGDDPRLLEYDPLFE